MRKQLGLTCCEGKVVKDTELASNPFSSNRNPKGDNRGEFLTVSKDLNPVKVRFDNVMDEYEQKNTSPVHNKGIEVDVEDSEESFDGQDDMSDFAEDTSSAINDALDTEFAMKIGREMREALLGEENSS